MQKSPEPQPHLVPTTIVTAGWVAGVCAVLAYVAARQFYGELPALPWLSVGAIVLLAIVCIVLARAIAPRVRRKPGTEPIEALVVARAAAFAKASILVGSAYAGVMLGFGVWLVPEASDLDAAGRDLPVAGVGLLTGLILASVAFWLQRTCRIPPEDDTDGRRNDSHTV